MQDVARGVHFSLARSRVLNWELTTGGWKESGTAAGRTPQRTLTGIMDSIKKPTHELLGIFHPWILPACPRAPPVLHMPYAHTSPPCGSSPCMLLMVPWADFGRWLRSMWRKSAQSVGQEETTNLSCSATFGNTEALDLVLCRVQRRHRSLRILPQERARSME